MYKQSCGVKSRCFFSGLSSFIPYMHSLTLGNLVKSNLEESTGMPRFVRDAGPKHSLKHQCDFLSPQTFAFPLSDEDIGRAWMGEISLTFSLQFSGSTDCDNQALRSEVPSKSCKHSNKCINCVRNVNYNTSSTQIVHLYPAIGASVPRYSDRTALLRHAQAPRGGGLGAGGGRPLRTPCTAPCITTSLSSDVFPHQLPLRCLSISLKGAVYCVGISGERAESR